MALTPGRESDHATDPEADLEPEPVTGPGAELLARAQQVARDDQPEGWPEVSDTVMSRVRALVAPSEPLLTFTADGESVRDPQGSRTWVSSRIAVTALRRALRSPQHVLHDVDLTVDDDRLTRVDVEVVCAYGPDLLELAEVVREAVLAELVSLLGPDPAFGADRISVEVVDVVLGDPTVV